MDTFDDEHTVGREFHLLAVVLTLSRNEIIFGNFHPLTFHQTGEVVLQQMVLHGFDVVEVVVAILHGFDVVEVVVAIRQLGRIHTVHEIIVGGNGIRPQATSQQLDAESLAESRLSR